MGAAEMDRAWPGSQEARGAGGKQAGYGGGRGGTGWCRAEEWVLPLGTAYKDILILLTSHPTACPVHLPRAGCAQGWAEVRGPPPPHPLACPASLPAAESELIGLLGPARHSTHLLILPTGMPYHPPSSRLSA